MIECDFIHKNGEKIPVSIEKKSWNNKRDFLSKLPTHKFWFAGNDRDIQYIKGIIGEFQIPVSYGSYSIGYAEDENGNGMYILPNKTISENPEPLKFVSPPGENPIESVFHPILDETIQKDLMSRLFPTLYKLHEPLPLYCALGWFFSTPFKPYIMKNIHHFPILDVLGAKGSGKTSLLSLLWRLFAFQGDMFSASLSAFSWIKTLSASNCFPICFDEFKTSDMSIFHMGQIQQFIRKIYSNEVEMRGRPDQSLVKYHLHAPVVIVGESAFQEPAILERIVPVSLFIRSLSSEYRRNFRTLENLPLQAFLPVYLRWCLSQNPNQFWKNAKKSLKNATRNFPNYIPYRVLDNITIVLFGLNALFFFTKDHGLPEPKIDSTQLCEYFINEIMEEKNSRIALDNLLEKMADIAERDEISQKKYMTKGLDYKIEGNILFLRLKPCLDVFKKWAREHKYKEEILEYRSYQKMIKERIGEYIIEEAKIKRFGNLNYRCMWIDIQKAINTGVQLQGFLFLKEEKG